MSIDEIRDPGWKLVRHGVRIVFEGDVFCPLTFYCFKKTGQKFNVADYLEAGRVAGLSDPEIHVIQHNADNDRDTPLRRELCRLCS